MSNSILHLENSFPWNKDPFYIFNNDDEKLAFKKWFIENANKYEINSFYKYASDLLGQVILSGCYGNGQYISIKTDAHYVEGLVLANGTYTFNEYIPHGFNIIDNKVIDYSYKKILLEAPQYLSKMPTQYFGIEIPKEYILTQNKIIGDTPASYHRPLLLEYWRTISKHD